MRTDQQTALHHSFQESEERHHQRKKQNFRNRYADAKIAGFSSQEHHAKQPDKSVEDYITDKKSHLYTLEIRPNNKYFIYVDQKQVAKGSLVDSLEPAILPPKEVDDPDDKKPDDWDEREFVADPDAKRPDDW